LNNLVIAGASGFVGTLVTNLACKRFATWNVHPLVRNTTGSFENEVALPLYLSGQAPGRATHLCLCLGTTPHRAGGNAQFVSTEHDLALQIARRAAALGARQLTYISSAGASLRSNSIYLETKARTEASLAELGFDRLDFFRPSFLTGRKSPRFSEAAGASAIGLAAVLFPKLRNSIFMPISGHNLAQAICNALEKYEAGVFVHHFPAIVELANDAQ
jgi:uncharacterized protein YbjT (DUF2867 family)